jgi:hypothetical protein
MRKSFRALCGLLFLAAPVLGAGGGTSGADLLKNPPGVRPAALAGTYSSFGDDVYVIGFNPAGLTRVAKYSLGLDHVRGLADVSTESVCAAMPTHRFGVLGAQILYRHMPPIQNALAADPPVKAADYLLTLAMAKRWGRFSAGGSFKTLVSTLADEQSIANALDFGARWTLKFLEVSAAVQNLGPSVGYDSGEKDPLPLTARFGFSRPIVVTPQTSLLAAVEVVQVRDEGFQPSLGVEYWHRTLLALRVGYKGGDADNLATGFAAGAAFRNSFGRLEYEMGYAWHPARIQSGFTMNTHLFGLLLWY